jgi:hypothetical protein
MSATVAPAPFKLPWDANVVLGPLVWGTFVAAFLSAKFGEEAILYWRKSSHTDRLLFRIWVALMCAIVPVALISACVYCCEPARPGPSLCSSRTDDAYVTHWGDFIWLLNRGFCGQYPATGSLGSAILVPGLLGTGCGPVRQPVSDVPADANGKIVRWLCKLCSLFTIDCGADRNTE